MSEVVATVIVGLMIALVTWRIGKLEYARGMVDGFEWGMQMGHHKARQETLALVQEKVFTAKRDEYMKGLDAGVHRGTQEERERWIAVGVALVAQETSPKMTALLYRYVNAARQEGVLSAQTVDRLMKHLGVDVMRIGEQKNEDSTG